MCLGQSELAERYLNAGRLVVVFQVRTCRLVSESFDQNIPVGDGLRGSPFKFGFFSSAPPITMASVEIPTVVSESDRLSPVWDSIAVG